MQPDIKDVPFKNTPASGWIVAVVVAIFILPLSFLVGKEAFTNQFNGVDQLSVKRYEFLSTNQHDKDIENIINEVEKENTTLKDTEVTEENNIKEENNEYEKKKKQKTPQNADQIIDKLDALLEKTTEKAEATKDNIVKQESFNKFLEELSELKGLIRILTFGRMVSALIYIIIVFIVILFIIFYRITYVKKKRSIIASMCSAGGIIEKHRAKSVDQQMTLVRGIRDFVIREVGALESEEDFWSTLLIRMGLIGTLWGLGLAFISAAMSFPGQNLKDIMVESGALETALFGLIQTIYSYGFAVATSFVAYLIALGFRVSMKFIKPDFMKQYDDYVGAELAIISEFSKEQLEEIRKNIESVRNLVDTNTNALNTLYKSIDSIGKTNKMLKKMHQAMGTMNKNKVEKTELELDELNNSIKKVATGFSSVYMTISSIDSKIKDAFKAFSQTLKN
ncbi:hypothetical protein K8I28_14785 [bacterium]|nr:hypothetical protein [bacterium]